MSLKQLLVVAEMVQKLLKQDEVTKLQRDLQFRLERDYPMYKSKMTRDEKCLVEGSITSSIRPW